MTETPQASNPKQVLADLIDAYASAKQTGNETLTRLAVQPLHQFIQGHDFVPAAPGFAAAEQLPDGPDEEGGAA